jgi:exodeoxyribonuclease VII small subunit
MESRLTKATKSSLPKEDLEQALALDPTLPQDFETALAELESLVASMESGSLALEQSLIAYRRGAALTRICQQKLAQAEQQVKVLEAGMLRPLDADSQTTE